ncbi:lipoprotein insertase outer membrane protein LolB [Legionella dresdenensis]|uniref:Outer-membrane lipoprotein LolB n=1 Tax=Legionella dresdenensis TaxID=450200 RepID=A0ABV8CFA1_9GAMM
MNLIKSFCLSSVVLLTACAPKPPVEPADIAPPKQQITSVTAASEATPDTKDQKQKQAQTASAKASARTPGSWDLSGAIAGRSKNKAWSASINWLQQGANNYQIRLFGPLGSGTVMVAKSGGVVTYRDGPKTASSKSADAILQKEGGIRLPVSNLYYWVRGIPAPGSVQSAQRDANNNLKILRQSGYTIEYLSYNQYAGFVLPAQIRLQGNGVFIKLVIKRWKV